MDRIYQQIFESTAAGILLLDGEAFTILDLNRAACDILSRKAEELIGKSMTSLSADPEKLRRTFRSAAETGEGLPGAEFKTPSQTRIRFSLSIVIPGSVYQCTLFPPMERSDRLEDLLSLSPDPMFVMDDEFRYLHFFWGRAGEYGVEADRLVGKTVHQYLTNASAEKELSRYREVLSTGQQAQYRSRVRINGIPAVFSTRLQPIKDAEGRVRTIIGLSRDITEQEKGKRETNQLEKEIDYRKDFVMTAAHELRTPLQPILGYLHLLLDDPGSFGLTMETEKMLRTCLDNVERERHIVDRMLELSLLYAEKISINPSDVMLKPLVADIVKTGEYDRDAEITTDIPEDTHLSADRDCLYTVLECLISNAVRFNNPPKRVWIHYRWDDSFHQVAVKDNGIGIAPGAIRSIFEPFHLADAEKLSRQYNRIGLALSIARKYINLHGGTIEVESKVGEGSTFTVRIPGEISYGV